MLMYKPLRKEVSEIQSKYKRPVYYNNLPTRILYEFLGLSIYLSIMNSVHIYVLL